MLSFPFLVALVVCVVVFTAVAAASDLRAKRLPNMLTVPAFALGLVFHFARGIWEHGSLAGGGYELVTWSLAGFGVGFGILFVLWIIAGGGGGDVKLMGAVGAWLGVKGTLFVFFVATVFIIVMAAGVFVASMASDGVSRTMKRFFGTSRGKNREQVAVKRRLVAYALPVMLAVWVLFGLVGLWRYHNKPFPVFERGAVNQPVAVAHA